MWDKIVLVIIFVNNWILIRCRQFDIGPCQLLYLEPCTSDAIEFYMFTSDRPDDVPILLDNIKPEVPKYIDLKRTNKMIVHGYGGNIDFNATKLIRNAYLHQQNTNVIIVDWGKLSKLPCYPTAAWNTKQAGECTATFLLGLQANYPDFKSENLHAIGFSLGAHVLSFTSNALEKSIGIKFKRITGLDPALPFFATARSQWKLDLSDADFVDVIHSNAGVFGKIETCGHVDFYMNGGQSQPSCENDKNQPLCSHMMAAVYFAETITSKKGFWGTKCSSYFQYFFGFCGIKAKQQIIDDNKNQENFSEYNEFDNSRIIMGEYCSKSSEGVYFVPTNKQKPFAMGYFNADKKLL